MFYFKIVGSLLAVYMLITAHYPTNIAYLGHGRALSNLPDANGIWVRIAGGCFLVVVWVWDYSDLLSVIFSVAGWIALGVSFYTNHNRIL